MNRLALREASTRPRLRWCGARSTDLATRTTLRILGVQSTDIITRPLVVYLVAVRERWPATFVSAVAVIGGHQCDHAWVEIEGRALGAVAPLAEVDHREQFRHRSQVAHRLAPAVPALGI